MPKQNKDFNQKLSALIDQDIANNQSNNKIDSNEIEEEWLGDEEKYEGQLSIDVFQTDKHIVIKSAIAGVKPEDIDISLNNDTITIKGLRKLNEEIAEDDFFYRECYWGGFSRSIILPVDVITDKVNATIENGILTISLPKAAKPRSRQIEVKEIKDKAPKKAAVKKAKD